MTPEERELITGLFDRMRSFGAPEKDREAEAIINQAVRGMPDAPYMLVQSVLVQEHALQEAGGRIEDLERQVRALQGSGQAQTSGSGSFLGGLLGGGRPASEPRTGSVPQIGARATPSTYDSNRSPWSQGQGAPQQAAPPPASGGFLRTAMATAAGVAGGMLAAGAIRDMMGGNANANPATNTPTASEAASKNDLAAQNAADDAAEDARDTDASWDSSGDFGGDIEA